MVGDDGGAMRLLVGSRSASIAVAVLASLPRILRGLGNMAGLAAVYLGGLSFAPGSLGRRGSFADRAAPTLPRHGAVCPVRPHQPVVASDDPIKRTGSR